jgi:hypothetical protein
MRLQRRGGRKLIVTPEGAPRASPKPRRDEALVKAIVRAHRWRRRIESGQARSITDLAEQAGVTDANVCRSCHSLAWRLTLWRPSSTGGGRRACGWPRCWGTGRSGGRSSGGLSAFASQLDNCHSGSRLLKVASLHHPYAGPHDPDRSPQRRPSRPLARAPERRRERLRSGKRRPVPPDRQVSASSSG